MPTDAASAPREHEPGRPDAPSADPVCAIHTPTAGFELPAPLGLVLALVRATADGIDVAHGRTIRLPMCGSRSRMTARLVLSSSVT